MTKDEMENKSKVFTTEILGLRKLGVLLKNY